MLTRCCCWIPMLVAGLSGGRCEADAIATATATAMTPVVAPAVSNIFSLRMPRWTQVGVEPPLTGAPAIVARPVDGGGLPWWFGPRVVLQVEPGTNWRDLVADRPLRELRVVASGLVILQAADAWSALNESAALAEETGVITCRPVMARAIRPHGPLAPPRNDPKFGALWHLENRWADGSPRGPDLNARGGWWQTRGEGVVVAVADDGVDLNHPDLSPAAGNSYHYSFTAGTTNGLPTSSADYHATLVAGFVLARDNNRVGVVGMAPRASLASWKIFNGLDVAFDDELMDMFQYRTDAVAVQNHSWGNADAPLLGPSLLEEMGISNALTFGRQGRGVVMVRSAGNGREAIHNVNDDGYANDPRVIAVAAVDREGHAATYSSPGACILVSGFGGGDDRALTTTDRVGAAGQNSRVDGADGADYWTSTSLRGTSFSAPQVSGLVALLLAANPGLTIRDVQQILILSSRHWDPSDSDRVINSAGFQHSHNVGFGVPDAGIAVAVARSWINRPEVFEHRVVSTEERTIPDDGMWVILGGNDVPLELRSVPSTPASGPLVDGVSATLPLVDAGVATNDLAVDLTGRAALIRRGPAGDFPDDRNTFRRKIERAAAAGAEFVVVYNDRDETARLTMAETDFIPVPAVMISQAHGESMVEHLTSEPTTEVRIELQSATYALPVEQTLLCEHVGVRLETSQPRRGDLQLTLRSPQGTSSTLQRVNSDTSPGPSDWTSWSTRHFGEPAQGTWTVSVTDAAPGISGTVFRVELILRGVQIVDEDVDGLADAWEQEWFGDLGQGPDADPDGDGWVNAQEQLLGTDPANPPVFQVWTSLLSPGGGLLTWDALLGESYDVMAAADPAGPFDPVGSLTAARKEMEWVVPVTSAARFFRVIRR